MHLATLRAAAAATGWGAGIAPTAALVAAVSAGEGTRVATVAAPLVAVATALAGYETVAYGDAPPVYPVPTVPLAWGATEFPTPRRRFDAVAVDATTTLLAPEWLDTLFARLAFRGGRAHLAILCTTADAPAYLRECHAATWNVQGIGTAASLPRVVLLASARFRVLGS